MEGVLIKTHEAFFDIDVCQRDTIQYRHAINTQVHTCRSVYTQLIGKGAMPSKIDSPASFAFLIFIVSSQQLCYKLSM